MVGVRPTPKRVLLLSHNGMGDNLYMIGMVRFLLTLYQEGVCFLCKSMYHSNVRMLFSDTNRVVIVPFDETRELVACRAICGLWMAQNRGDLIVCGGWHKRYLRSSISHRALLGSTANDGGYDLNCDMLTDQNYRFIKGFYNDAGLGLSVFYDYWQVPEYKESNELFQLVKDYRIVFLQTTSSGGEKLNIDNLLAKYIGDARTILISNDENLYAGKDAEKASICEKFVRNRMVYYLDTIKNSSEVYIIDSCFIGLVLPMYKKGLLKADIVRIILRSQARGVRL